MLGNTTRLLSVCQYENGLGNCLSIKQHFFLQNQTYCPALWATLQAISHKSNFFGGFCSKVKTWHFWSIVDSNSSQYVFYLAFHHNTFLTSAGKFYLEGTDKNIWIHPRCKCLSRLSLTKDSKGHFQPSLVWQISTSQKQSWMLYYFFPSSIIASHLKPESFQCSIL